MLPSMIRFNNLKKCLISMDEDKKDIIKSVFHPKGYQVFHLTMPYENSEGRLLFFINAEKYRGDIEKQLLLQNGFIIMLHKLSDLKLVESQRANRNVGIKEPLTDFFEDENDGYDAFWEKQQIKPEGLEQLCWLKEDWWGGHDSYLFIKKDPKIEQQFITQGQAGLLEYSIQYYGEKLNEEKLKDYSGAWGFVCSMPFRNILDKTFYEERRKCKVYKNFDRGLLESGILEKSEKLANLIDGN